MILMWYSHIKQQQEEFVKIILGEQQCYNDHLPPFDSLLSATSQ